MNLNAYARSKKIKSKILYKTIFFISVLIAGYISALNIYTLTKVNAEISTLEEKNAKEILNKAVLVNKIAYTNLEDFKKEALNDHKKNLKNLMEVALSVVQNHYNGYKNGKLTLEEAKRLTFERISQIRYGENQYFFILDDNYTLVSHPNKNLQGQNHYNLKDIKGNYLSRNIVDETRAHKESFTTYWWEKTEGIETEKITYAKEFNPWKIYIGTGVHIENIGKEIIRRKGELFNQLNNIMRNTKVGKSGYIFVFDKTGKILIHPDDTMINSYIDKDLFYDFAISAKSKKPTNYTWSKISDRGDLAYDKIVWIEYVPEQEWYIGASAYLEDLEKSTDKLNFEILLLSLIIFMIFVLISFVFFKKLLSPVFNLSKVANLVSHGDYSARVDCDRVDELGMLSQNFNDMIDSIEKNREKEKQLIEQSRLAQMGEMMSMIAHQWRQPLGAISSAIMGMQVKIQRGKYNLAKDTDRVEFLSYLDRKHTRVNEYVQFLSSTIDDFKEFFKQDIDKQLVPLTLPIQSALEITEVSLRNKKIKILKKFEVNDEVLIHKNELMQVILNILKNSEDNFIEKNTPSPQITIKTSRNKETYTISISDNGGGVPEDILPKIFEPYFSTKLEKSGTGLGLYMSKVITEEHNNGTLHVNNIKDGACFEIALPIHNNLKKV